MKNIYTLFIFLFTLGYASSPLFAYQYMFTNRTNKEVTIRFNLKTNDTWWQHTIAPGASAQEWFPWIHEKITDWEHNRRANWCIETLEIAEQVPTASVSTAGHAIQAQATEWKKREVTYINPLIYSNLLTAAKQFAQDNGKSFEIGRFVTPGKFSTCINRDFDIIQDTHGIQIVSKAQQ